MDLIKEQYDDMEEEILPIEVVNVEPRVSAIVKKQEEYVASIEDPEQAALERERLKRKLEMEVWAEERKLIHGSAPTDEQLDAIFNKLKAGETLKKALEGICSWMTWSRWREKYPVIMAMEDEARQQRIWDLQEKQRRIADGEDIDGHQLKPEEDNIKKITRAKLRIDTMQSEIDRHDRLTQARNGKTEKSSTLVPIQINVGYGRKPNT